MRATEQLRLAEQAENKVGKPRLHTAELVFKASFTQHCPLSLAAIKVRLEIILQATSC